MKKLLVAGFAVMVMGASLSAETEKKSQVEMQAKNLERLTKELNLTPEQQATFRSAFDERAQTLEKIRKESIEKSKAAYEEADTKIQIVLTEEQRKKYATVKEEKKAKLRLSN